MTDLNGNPLPRSMTVRCPDCGAILPPDDEAKHDCYDDWEWDEELEEDGI